MLKIRKKSFETFSRFQNQISKPKYFTLYRHHGCNSQSPPQQDCFAPGKSFQVRGVLPLAATDVIAAWHISPLM